METRKLIAFGESTFSVTLPRKWVLKSGLKKGDTISIRELPLGRLEISPAGRGEPQEPKRASVTIDGRPLKEVQREVIAAYIKGYDIIDIMGDHTGKVAELRRRLHELIAVEIMEVAPQRITANVFSDLSTIPLPRVISRIELMTRTILEETQEILKKGGSLDVTYRELMEKKREVDRQSLFAIRAIVNALTDPVAALRMEMDPLRLSFIWHLVEYMEKVSDYILNVAFYLTTTDALRKLGREGRDGLYRIFVEVGRTYETALRAYNKNSLSIANEVFDLHARNERLLFEYLDAHLNRWVPVIIGYLRRTSSKSRDISKIAINLNTK